MNLESQLLETVRTLSPEAKLEVLDFARLLGQHPPPMNGPRPIGLCAGELVVPDDFDAPLPEDVLRAFEQ